MVPDACNCKYGNTGNCTEDYGWNNHTLGEFVSWAVGKGVSRLAIWRADIYPAYCTRDGDGVDPWTYPILEEFLRGGGI